MHGYLVMSDVLAKKVLDRFAARPNRRGPPTPFQPRIKQRDWADITKPDGIGDFSDVTKPGEGNFVDITKVTKEGKTKFEKGDKIRIKPSHGLKEWHGDTGVVDKYVQFGKYYVELKENGRQIVSENDLELIGDKKAWTGLPGDIGAIAQDEQCDDDQQDVLAMKVASRFLKTAVIREEGGKFCVRSPNNPKWNGGCFQSKAEAEARLKSVEYFKRK